MEIKADINYGKLKKLVEAMSDELSVKVGLLAKTPGEKGVKGSDEVSSDIDIAGLGAVHEFGKSIQVTDKMRGFFRHQFRINLKKTTTHIHIPPRSFLLMPLTKKEAVMNALKTNLKEEGIAEDDILKYFTETGDIKFLGDMLGTAAVSTVLEAFESGGDGQWAPDSALTIANKGSSKPLMDKGNLRGAVAFEVEKK